ncbi:hypothetical protein DQ04_03221020 [Trypanosoma grayi]|uniref:hypothetical protein n=1 Tax=Trypanosoma grayi TaxID=71804 RepID=UPI0004F45860|nr:hypothetical protein DQ04_03221020 [Trypanosoma grayi]KEG10852.1 hypothetical protein DQ04_03221020 [Trypanosoma grayi]
MLERAVLEGHALQLWELPARLHGNEALLRDFFVRHFDRTPASRIKTVAFGGSDDEDENNHSNGGGGRRSKSLRVGGEAIVEFFEEDGVKHVLSRIIQHELLERDEASHIELRRGFVYLGHDRLLVEGVVHLVQLPDASDSTAAAAAVGGGAAQHRGFPAAPQREGGAASRTDGGTRKNLMEKNDWSTEEDNDDDDDDDEEEDDNEYDEEEKEGGKEERHAAVKRVASLQQERPAGGACAVVLCMTFVCTFNRHRRDSARSHEGENDFGVTPHVIFQLLRGTCLVRKVVMFRRDSTHEGGGGSGTTAANGNANRQMVRALVEVGDEEEAKRVVNAFHATTLELACPAPNENETEFRCRVYTRYDDDARANRQLAVPVNTHSALCVTPQNLAMMGSTFRRCRYDEDAHGGDRMEGGAAAARDLVHGGWQHREDGATRHNDGEEDDGHDRGRRRRERSSEERHRHRRRRRHSHERRKHSSSRHRSRNRDSRRRSPSNEDMHGAHRRSALATIPDASSHHGYLYPHQQYREQQQQQQRQHQQQEQEQQLQLQQRQPTKEVLPPGWRAVYSEQYQRMYYVHRDPVTGVEVSSWEVTPMP